MGTAKECRGNWGQAMCKFLISENVAAQTEANSLQKVSKRYFVQKRIR